MQFSQEQQNVISLTEGWHTCLASAGSGKTEILTERIYQALQSQQHKPHEMLSLTFTNQAALSMQNRVTEKLKDKFPSNLYIGNIHTLGIKLLGKHHFPRGYSLADEKTADQNWSLATAEISSILQNKLEELIDSTLSRADPCLGSPIIANLSAEFTFIGNLKPRPEGVVTCKRLCL